MNQAQYDSLKHLRGKLPNWQKTDYRIASMLDRAIPYIGDVTITSTWRSSTGVGPAGSLHKYPESLAIDFVPKSKNLWAVYLTLVKLGFRRIGIRPDASMIHVDAGVEAGVARAYVFFEGPGGVDFGPLAGQSAARIASIPGYGSSAGVSVASVAGSTPAGVVISIIIIAGLLWSRYQGYV